MLDSKKFEANVGSQYAKFYSKSWPGHCRASAGFLKMEQRLRTQQAGFYFRQGGHSRY